MFIFRISARFFSNGYMDSLGSIDCGLQPHRESGYGEYFPILHGNAGSLLCDGSSYTWRLQPALYYRLAVFYGIYFEMVLIQKRHGIRTHQIGCRIETHSIGSRCLRFMGPFDRPGRIVYDGAVAGEEVHGVKQKRKLPGWAVWVLILWALGLLVFLFAAACRFAALGFFGLGGITGIYGLLSKPAPAHPKGVRLLRGIFTGGLCLLALAMAVTLGGILHAAQGDPDQNCDYVLVLGAGVDGERPSRSLQERLTAAESYLRAHPQTICVVSGGQGGGEDITEAECMYRELTARGIEAGRILLEDRASTTAENIRFTLELLEKEGIRLQKLGIVSSEYHLFRAKLMASRLGVEAVGIPAKTGLLPLKLTYFFREIFGVWYYWIFH